MRSDYNIENKDYSFILKDLEATFTENDHWLIVGDPVFENNWLLFISIRPINAIELFKIVTPVLLKENVPFKMVKDQKFHFKINDGSYVGEEENSGLTLEFAKAITVYTTSVAQAKKLATLLCSLTNSFSGPEMPDALRIGKVLYTCSCQLKTDEESGRSEQIIAMPDPDKTPFKIEKNLPYFKYKRRIFNGAYVPIEVLRHTDKNIILKGINLKRLSLTWCLMKMGRAYSFEDSFGRDVRNRMVWEKEVLEILAPIVRVPKVISLFNGERFTCLVLEWIQGESLNKRIKSLYQGKEWHELPMETKCELLSYYTNILDIIEKIHLAGFIHRDLTCTNFIIEPDNNVCVLDFELSYSVERGLPYPPFVMGTPGYVSPEQYYLKVPAITEDIYSLGSVLMSLLTGKEPEHFIKENPDSYKQKLLDLTQSEVLTNLVKACRERDKRKRPSIEYIRNAVYSNLKELNNPEYYQITENNYPSHSNLVHE